MKVLGILAVAIAAVLFVFALPVQEWRTGDQGLAPSLPWIVERSRGWLDYWRTSIGRPGFFPFDLLAAAYVVDPSLLGCIPVRAWVGEDDTLFLPWAPQALLVEPDADGAALYCGRADDAAKRRVMAFFR